MDAGGTDKEREAFERDSHDHRVSGLDEQEVRGAGPTVAPVQAWGPPKRGAGPSMERAEEREWFSPGIGVLFIRHE
jgi:hypothetical protein